MRQQIPHAQHELAGPQNGDARMTRKVSPGSMPYFSHRLAGNVSVPCCRTWILSSTDLHLSLRI